MTNQVQYLELPSIFTFFFPAAKRKFDDTIEVNMMEPPAKKRSDSFMDKTAANQIYTCLICGIEVGSRLYIARKHVLVHHMNSPEFKCKYCGYGTHCKSEVMDHCTAKHKNSQAYVSNLSEMKAIIDKKIKMTYKEKPGMLMEKAASSHLNLTICLTLTPDGNHLQTS